MLFVFLVVLSNFLTIPVVGKKIREKLAFAVLTGTPTTLGNRQGNTPPVVALKTIKILSV